MIFSTLGLEKEKPQKKLLNYLLFGSLGYYMVENILKSTHIQGNQQSMVNVNEIQPMPKKPSIAYNKELAKSAENISSIEHVNKEISLDDLLFELIQETSKVTISKVVVQFLKINTKLDSIHLVLSTIVSIVIFFFSEKFR